MLRQRRLIPPARHHHPHRPPAPGPHQERQEIQRLTVRPVHILHHQPHPGPATSRPPRPAPPPPRRTTAPGSTPRPGRRARPASRPQPRQQPPHLLPHIPRGGIQRRRQQPAALQPAQLAQRIRHRQQRQRARQRQALPPHHHHPRRRGPGHPLGREPGLAHPRIPHHQHQPRIAAQRPQQPGQLTLTANKARRPRHVPAHQPAPPGQLAIPSKRGHLLLADSCNFSAPSDYRTPVHFVSRRPLVRGRRCSPDAPRRGAGQAGACPLFPA